MTDQPQPVVPPPDPDICDANIEIPTHTNLGPDDFKALYWQSVSQAARIRDLEETCAMFAMQVRALKDRNATLTGQAEQLTAIIDGDKSRRVTSIQAKAS